MVALALVHANTYLIPVALLLVVGGLLSQRVDTVVVGAAISVLCLSPMLLKADLDATSLRTGYRWRRRTVELVDVVEVQIGRIRRFGFRGGDAMGMKLLLNSGAEVLVLESQFCSQERLSSWGAAMALRAPGLRVSRGLLMEL